MTVTEMTVTEGPRCGQDHMTRSYDPVISVTVMPTLYMTLKTVLLLSKFSITRLLGTLVTVNSVFAIHGLGSNPDSAWTARRNGTEVRWLRDLLPRVEGVGHMRVAMINHQ